MSDELLHDILARVTRIENNMNNGWRCNDHKDLCSRMKTMNTKLSWTLATIASIFVGVFVYMIQLYLRS